MPETGELITMAALLLAIGGFAGVIAGLLGVGGGIVLVPAFFFAFTTLGYGGPDLMQVCLATSLATICVTSLRSLHAHHRKGAVDWAILRGWAPGIALGAVAGVVVVSGLRTPVLQAIFGTLALLVASYLGLGRSHWRLGAAMPTWRSFPTKRSIKSQRTANRPAARRSCASRAPFADLPRSRCCRA